MERTLRSADLPEDPMTLFRQWFATARAEVAYLPEAMALATSADGRPSVRMVLLKEVTDAGFVFFTNYRSRKGASLSKNPAVAASLWWPKLERQVRITGHVRIIDAARSDAYFASRPRASQLGAWASPQSQPLRDREVLERAFERLDRQHYGEPISRPPHWGGYEITPDTVEFWQGRRGRLHDRFEFARSEDGWVAQRLAP